MLGFRNDTHCLLVGSLISYYVFVVLGVFGVIVSGSMDVDCENILFCQFSSHLRHECI